MRASRSGLPTSLLATAAVMALAVASPGITALAGCTAAPVTEVIGDRAGRVVMLDAPADEVFRVTVETLEDYGFRIEEIDRLARILRTDDDPYSEGREFQVLASVDPLGPYDARLRLLIVRPIPGGRLPQETEPLSSEAYRQLLDAIQARLR